MRHLAATALCLLAVYGPYTSTAHANIVPPNSPDVTQTAVVQETLNIAQRYWHATPACQTIKVYLARIEPTDLGIAEQPGCTILLAYQTYYWLDETFSSTGRLACEVITHEYGHLLGNAHNTDPLSIMHPAIENPYAVPDCTTWSAQQGPPNLVRWHPAKQHPRHSHQATAPAFRRGSSRAHAQ